MLTRKCAQCGVEMPLDKNNSTGIVLYKKKYYHRDCFAQLCEEKLNNKNVRNKEPWQQALDGIDELRSEATKEISAAICKDELYQFIFERYRLSYVGNAFYTKMDAIYTGEYKGLAYPIGPEELLAEWQYYWEFLLSSTQFKDITGEPLVSYHLAVLMSKNAEYREEMARKKVEEQVRAAQREDDIDMAGLAAMQKSVSERLKQTRRQNFYGR